jgi:nucleotide-binding universal stress UspA family protein
MFARVVVPVGFSPESDRALAVVPALAEWAGASIELVTVTEPNDRSDKEPRLAEAAERLGPGTKWRIVESDGPVDAALVAELHRGENELWCVGSHARGALGEMIIGSLSEQFVREAHAPVVLVGPHAEDAPTGRVLAAVLDGTEQSEAILPAAADLAVALGMTLRLLQVSDADLARLPRDSSETAYLARAAAKVPSINPHEVDYDVLHGGHPAHNLSDYATANPDVGMIAMLTRGLTGGERLLHGSSAFELVHRAKIPVAILRLDDDQD